MATIPLPQLKEGEEDIYSFGFDKNLYRYSGIGDEKYFDERFNDRFGTSADMGGMGFYQTYRTYDAIVDVSGGGDFLTIEGALAAGKQSIFVKKGTYDVSSPITILNDDVSIVGENKSSVIVRYVGGTIMRIGSTATTVNNITVKNLNFSGSTYGISIVKVKDLQILDCLFSCTYGIYQAGLSSASDRVFISGNIFTGSRMGIYLYQGDASNWYIVNSYIENTYADASYSGIRIVSSDAEDIIISNNFINAYSDCIYVYSASGVVISSNILKSDDWNGIFVGKGGIRKPCIISNNYIHDCYYRGIYSFENEGVIIMGNSLLNCGLYGNDTTEGIGLSTHTGNSLYNQVKGNTIINDNTSGINLNAGIRESEFPGSTSDYTFIEGNIIKGWATTAVAYVGGNTIVGTNMII